MPEPSKKPEKADSPKPSAIFAVVGKDLRMRVPDSLLALLSIKPGDALLFEVYGGGDRIEVKNPNRKFYGVEE